MNKESLSREYKFRAKILLRGNIRFSPRTFRTMKAYEEHDVSVKAKELTFNELLQEWKNIGHCLKEMFLNLAKPIPVLTHFLCT